jgi:dihydroxyacetone kinase-like predicted kinase
MDKNPFDAIIKASRSLQESAKDTASANLVMAVRTGQVKVDQANLQKLLHIVGASIEEGHSRANRSFSKVVTECLAEQALPILSPKKKRA